MPHLKHPPLISLFLLLYFGILPCSFAKNAKKTWVIDKIISRVNGINILKSDLERPQLEKEDQQPFTLAETINQELMYQKAAADHVLPNQQDIERQIVSLKMNTEDGHQMSDQEFEDQLQSFGFTMHQYKTQLGRALAIQNVKRIEVSEKIIVTSQEVENFYKKNPHYTKETYHLHIVTLNDEEIQHYKTLIKDKKISWKDLSFIEKDDLDKRYHAVLKLKKGEITKPIKSKNRHVILKLVEKQEQRLKTLDERYTSIERQLLEEKAATLVQSFNQELLSKATIVFP